MDGKQKRPFFWPTLFLGAFLLGAVLWGIWMYNIVERTRQQRQQQEGFFVPQSEPVLNSTNGPAVPAGPPPARTN